MRKPSNRNANALGPTIATTPTGQASYFGPNVTNAPTVQIIEPKTLYTRRSSTVLSTRRLPTSDPATPNRDAVHEWIEQNALEIQNDDPWASLQNGSSPYWSALGNIDIPSEIGLLTRTHRRLIMNSVLGSMPEELCGLNALHRILAADHNLTGNLPMARLTSLQVTETINSCHLSLAHWTSYGSFTQRHNLLAGDVAPENDLRDNRLLGLAMDCGAEMGQGRWTVADVLDVVTKTAWVVPDELLTSRQEPPLVKPRIRKIRPARVRRAHF